MVHLKKNHYVGNFLLLLFILLLSSIINITVNLDDQMKERIKSITFTVLYNKWLYMYNSFAF